MDTLRQNEFKMKIGEVFSDRIDWVFRIKKTAALNPVNPV